MFGRRLHLGPTFGVGLAGFVATVLGWASQTTGLALGGALVLCSALLIYVWQRYCLTGVSYHRTISGNRANFGEQLHLDVEVVNDKALPLTWLEIEDEYPAVLNAIGATVVRNLEHERGQLTQLVAMLPYQRLRRRVTIPCDARGRFVIGPATLRSGDPLRTHVHESYVRDPIVFLVYPKVFALSPAGIAPRVVLGTTRANLLVDDPIRVAGVRDYRPGDPLRAIDWRATARRSSLLVREYEPTASLRAAVFIDLPVPRGEHRHEIEDVVEFTIALAASVITSLSDAGITVGLFASGTAQQRPISHAPSSSPAALAEHLELLAEASPFGPVSFADVLVRESAGLSSATSVVVISSEFAERSAIAMAARRRRGSVTAIWIERDGGGSPPPRSAAEVVLRTPYLTDWRGRDAVELVS
jgi:uncharacterized protein (DUF58 family)